MAKNNNVETHKKNTKIENDKRSELKPKETTKKKKLRLHSHLRVNIPLFQSLMMILPSLAKHAEATEGASDSANDKYLTTANSVVDKDIVDTHTNAAPLEATHQNIQKNESQEIPDTTESQAPHGANTHLVPSHHLSTLSHPQVHYIPSVSMPTISAGGNGQPTHSNTPPTPTTPVTFIPEVIKGTYGELHVDVNGQYTFILNPNSPQYILLNQHQQGTDHFALHLSNGASIVVQIPVTGKQDLPSISGDLAGAVTEDHNIDSQGLLHANGKIDVIDPDQNESSVTPEVITGKYGSLTIDADGHWKYQVDNSLSNVQALTGATSLHESFTIHTKDGTPQTIDMTIGGNDDNAVITGVDAGSVVEDLTTQVQGQLSVTDPDLGEDHFQASQVNGHLGTLTIDKDGSWTYDLDNTNPNVQALGQGATATDTVTVHSADGTQHQVTVTINGTNDKAVIGGISSGAVTEESQLKTSGTLTITDVDTGEAHFSNTDVAGALGTLHLKDNGAWTYDLDNTNPTVQALGKGATATDTVTVHSADGTPHQITVTVNGTNDKAVIGGTSSGTVTEESQLQTSGTLMITDVDTGEAHFSNTDVAGALGTLHLKDNGTWTYDLDNTNPKVQALGKGATATDTVTVHSADGTPHQITVTINGTNDRPTISGTSSGAVSEQGLNTAGTPDATGSLTATDLDKSDTVTWAINQPQGQWGTLSIDQNGHWHYQLDNSTGGATDKLAAGEHQSESFWITATDSAGATVPHKIVIDVQGSNDKPIVSAWTQLPAGKEDQPVTIKASDLLTHASDVDSSDVLHVTNLQATHGSLTDNKDGTYTFTPDKDFNGEIRLTYDVVDAHGGSVSTQAKFDLTATPDNAIITDAQTNADLRGVTEDRGYIDTHYQLHYDGKLNIQDPDAGEAQFDPNIGPQTYQGYGYNTKLGGHILLMRDGHYTYTLDNRNIQNLAQGEVKHDSAVIRSADGTTHTIELTVHGTNDAPVINAQSHSVTEDGQLLTGQMQGHDIDHGATLTYSIAQAVDGLTFNPDGSYSFDPSHPSYQSLVQGQTQTLTVPVTVTDEHGASAMQNLEIMVTGSNDGAQISGTDTGDVYESAYTDRSPDYQRGNISHFWNDHIHTSGKLDIVDSDAGEAHFDNNAPAYQYFGQYGRLILQPDGNWYYRVDVGDSAIGRKIDALNTGENLTDTITIRSADGTTHDVVITIHGDNDSPFASSEVQLNSGKEDNAQTITEAQLLANSMDVDTSDAGKLHVDNLQVDHGSIRDNQDGTYTFTPEKDYNGQVHFTYDVKDAHSGVTHTGATMTLAPVGDAATIIGTDTGSITEDRHVFPDSMHHIQVTGSLSVSDPDAGEDHFRESGAFGYEKAISDPFQGEMHIDRYGNWDYVLANGNPALQALKQGETKDVIYEVHSAGGTPHRITITVTGTNDAPTVSSSVTLAAGKEDTAVTLQASDLLAHASDIDHNAQLSIHNLSADHGQIVDNHDGTFRFIPDKDYNGPVQFSYQVQDEHGASVAQTASMNLVAVNDVATISGDSSASVTEGGSQGAMPDLTVAKGACLANIGSGFDFPPVIPNDPNTGRWYAVGGSEGPAGGVAQGLDLKHGFWVMNMGDPNYGVNGYALFTRNTNSATAHFNGVTDDAHGDLHISDPDATPDTFVNVQNQMGDHGYGTFTMKDGHWSFTAGDKATSLPDGAKAQETFTFRTHDGVTHQVTINLTGTDTPSEFKGDFSGNLREGNVGDNAAVHGSISITDPDTNQTPTLPDMPSTSGDNGYGSFTMHNGHWEYTLDQSKVQHVGAKETVQDKITVTASDGTKHDIVVTIQGTNDAPVVNGQTFITPQNGNTPIALSDLLANVRDPDTHDNQHLSVSHLQADHGTITPDGHGGYLYHPENGYKGPVDISYQVTDPEGASVSVHASMGSAPTASSGIIQMHEDSPHTFTAAEFSADNFDQLTISSLPDVTHGTLTFNGQPVAAGQHIDTAHIDQLVFTPAQNYHGDASFGFTVSENGMQSAAASGHIMVDSVTDAASISMHLSATESTMQTGQGNGLAVTRLDGSHLTHQTSPELTAEVVVKIPSGSHLNKESVLIQFGNAVAKGEQQGAAAVCKIYSDDSHTNTLNTFTVTNPQNLTIWLPGHKPIQTGIDITQNHDPHRLTFSVNTASHSATVYQDGQPVFHTNSAQIWHDSDLGMNSYNTAGDDAQIFGNPTFWFNHQGRGGDHIPIFIAKAVGHTGVNLGDGLHPLMNENGQVMYSDGQMKAPASDLSVQAVFTSAVIMQGEVTAQQVASGPLSESTPGIGSGRVLLELGIQGGQLVDHTGHQSNALEHHSLNSPLIGGDPLHHELNLDVQATDPDDHVSSVKLTGLPDGTILDDGHGHSATVQNGQAIDVQDWNRASIGVVLPNTAPTGDVHLHVEVTTTGPDGATATSTADNTSMHVSDVMTDTAPDIIQSIMLGDEDQTYHFSEQDFGYSDKDGDPLDHVTITQLPDPAHGQLLINGHAVTAGQEISVYDIGKLLFQPAKDFNGDVDFQYSVSDGLKYSAPSQGTLTIAPVVDVTIKLSPASDLGSSNTDHLTNDATPTITGYTDIPYSQVTIYDGSKPVGHAVSDASGQYSVVVNSLTDGNHNLSAKASTPSSGISATSSFLSVHIDTQVHVGIQMDPITADSVINAQESNSSINITGAVSGDFSIGDIVTLDVNGAQHTGTVDAKGHYSIAVPGSELIADADQQIEASIMVTDSAGNSVHAVTNGAYQVDTQVNLPTITFENPGPDGLYSKAEIAHGHPNTITATITPPSDAKVGEHLVVNGQDHLLDAHTLQHGIQIEVHPGSNVQATMTDEHGNTAGSQGVAASAIPEPIVVKPPSGSHQVSGTLGVPPLVPSAQNGWRIHLPNGQYVTSHHGQYGTLTIDPQTGDLHYQEQAQVHTGPHGSASGIGQHEDRFEIALQGTNQDEVVAHVNIQILSHGPGHSGKLTVGTEVVDMTITPIVHASHPAPPPVQHDEPEIASHEDFTFTVSEDTSLDLSQHAHQEPDQKTDHHGAAAYLDALGIQPKASPTTGHDQPADMDIVLAQVDQQHAADYDQTHLDMSDALEHHDAANNHNQDDEHHHHHDVDGLPDIDPNN